MDNVDIERTGSIKQLHMYIYTCVLIYLDIYLDINTHVYIKIPTNVKYT